MLAQLSTPDNKSIISRRPASAHWNLRHIDAPLTCKTLTWRTSSMKAGNDAVPPAPLRLFPANLGRHKRAKAHKLHLPMPAVAACHTVCVEFSSVHQRHTLCRANMLACNMRGEQANALVRNRWQQQHLHSQATQAITSNRKPDTPLLWGCHSRCRQLPAAVGSGHALCSEALALESKRKLLCLG
jgi:hypothetical protein